MAFEFEVNGKAVTLKERLSVKVAPTLPAMLTACQDGDFRTQVKVMRLVVESWGFEGSPNDPKAYEEMDIFSEFNPLSRKVGEYLIERLTGANGDLKN